MEKTFCMGVGSALLILLILIFPPLSLAAQQTGDSGRLAAEVPRQIANANTLFNLINTCIFLPFTGVFAWVATRLVPDKPPPPGPIQPTFLAFSKPLGHPEWMTDIRFRVEKKAMVQKPIAGVSSPEPEPRYFSAASAQHHRAGR